MSQISDIPKIPRNVGKTVFIRPQPSYDTWEYTHSTELSQIYHVFSAYITLDTLSTEDFQKKLFKWVYSLQV